MPGRGQGEVKKSPNPPVSGTQGRGLHLLGGAARRAAPVKSCRASIGGIVLGEDRGHGRDAKRERLRCSMSPGSRRFPTSIGRVTRRSTSGGPGAWVRTST